MVKFIKEPTGKPYNLAYFTEDEAEFAPELEAKLVEKGLAVYVTDNDVAADPAAKAAPDAAKAAKPVDKAEKR